MGARPSRLFPARPTATELEHVRRRLRRGLRMVLALQLGAPISPIERRHSGGPESNTGTRRLHLPTFFFRLFFNRNIMKWNTCIRVRFTAEFEAIRILFRSQLFLTVHGLLFCDRCKCESLLVKQKQPEFVSFHLMLQLLRGLRQKKYLTRACAGSTYLIL